MEEGTEGSINIKAVDADTGLQLMESISRKGDVGTDCVGYISLINGYNFISADITFTGKSTSLDQTVTLKYKKQYNVAPTTKMTDINLSRSAYV